ncbi:holo-ACP synthase [Bifidobacterium tissieri]|uniref:holo-ACP synthase n=1 Tax=Bifidobacterium tissieri TaxID=1630162 RepID=UPI00168A5E63|nr:holo-ACP synthase [Bifidobacterium tissieri]
MPILGLGHDVVDVKSFAEQLNAPGEGARRLFSARELRQAVMRGRAKNDGEAVHLAARWAGKEAVLKAWCEALGDRPAPYTLDDFPWTSIEILDDSHGRPQVAVPDAVRAVLESSVLSLDGVGGGPGRRHDLIWHISLSHDGPIASAVAILESR